MTIQERTIDVATRLFNYYNGKINRNNLAELRFQLEPDKDDLLGYYMYPNIICINIYLIIASSNFDTKEAINRTIETTLHELFHVDQKVLPGVIPQNEIEEPVYYKTFIFMRNNYNMICKLAGLSAHEVCALHDYIVDRYHRMGYGEFRTVYNRATFDDYLAGFLNYFIEPDTIAESVRTLTHNELIETYTTILAFKFPDCYFEYVFVLNGKDVYNFTEFNIFATAVLNKIYRSAEAYKNTYTIDDIVEDSKNGIYKVTIIISKLLCELIEEK